MAVAAINCGTIAAVGMGGAAVGVVWGVGVAATLTPPQRVSQGVVWVGAVGSF